jgi:anti-sigma28 factor (negative regulator of flagellin synthesis)
MGHMRRPPKTATSIDELRSRIERGRYEVKPDRVAQAMLRRGVMFQGPPKARPG